MFVLTSNSLIQVQINTEPCGHGYTGAFCINAVAVQAGRDVFVADLKQNDINFKMCENRVLYNNVRRSNGDQDYQVHIYFCYPLKRSSINLASLLYLFSA